ncbi:MAG TPA: AMP-binding protein [Streptosporangiaceae bacterium]|nr:AMP-binding protein [Streptosporangiaceae bacterium]
MHVSTIQAGDFLRLSAQRFPDRDCFVFGDGTSRSFAETNQRVNRLADALRRRGLAKGDRVAILGTDSGEYVEVILACMKLGVVYVPLNNRLADAEVLTLLRKARPRALFSSGRYLERVAALAPLLTGITLLCSLDGDRLLPFDALLGEGHDVEPFVEVQDEDVLALAFTSGTTGLPKGVLQSQRMLNALALNMSIDYEIMAEEFRYTASPIFHIAGQAMIFMHIMRGFPTLILPQFDAGPVLRWMQSGRLTGAFLVPTMISRLLSDPRVADGTYEGLRSIIYGAAPMTPALLRRAMSVFKCDFINAFGAATEGGLQASLSAADHRRAAAGAEHLLGSIGKPAFGVDLRLVNEDGQDVPPGEVGEIVTRSTAVMSGYLEMPEEAARAIRDGWFWGGDLARMDKDGYLYLAGRSKDMIIRAGENIYPIEIETVLADYPGVTGVAVVGQPDEHWGEIVVAFLTAEAGAAIERDAIRRFCRERLAAYKVPEVVTVIAEMPLNASGKILKRELRAGLAAANPVTARH